MPVSITTLVHPTDIKVAGHTTQCSQTVSYWVCTSDLVKLLSFFPHHWRSNTTASVTLGTESQQGLGISLASCIGVTAAAKCCRRGNIQTTQENMDNSKVTVCFEVEEIFIQAAPYQLLSGLISIVDMNKVSHRWSVESC